MLVSTHVLPMALMLCIADAIIFRDKEILKEWESRKKTVAEYFMLNLKKLLQLLTHKGIG